jgi:tRNA-2-methylthio-N6-dimethylallyladenosine synthase
MKNPKTFYVRTYGCQMNELDSELMVGVLENRGLTRTQESDADLLIYNTCSIRDLAERKVMGKLGQLAKNPRKDAIIGVTGCMANAKKDSLFHKLSHIDFVMGTNNIHDLDVVLDEVLAGGQRVIRTDDQFSHELDYISAKRDNKISAYVSIIRGCDKFCTYCVVPYTRGPEVSRNPDEIIKECKHLVDQGYQEITLLGQNVNSYGKDKQDWACLFHDLLYRIDKETGIKRIRFMTSHPVDITLELMEAIRDLKSMCEFVHFPLQAGSDRILKKMHRIYTLDQYLEKVEMLRKIVPGVVLGTDIIVGFPTETEEDFQMTYDIMKQVGYMTAYLYTFSPRKGTPALRWKDDIPEEVKQARLQKLMSLQDEVTIQGMQKMIGQTFEVLIERRSSKEDRSLQGMTRCWRSVVMTGEDTLIGTLQQVQIVGFSKQTLIGKILA